MQPFRDLFDPLPDNPAAADIAVVSDVDSSGIEDPRIPAPADHSTLPIAIPCGFSDRNNNRCRRLGTWPVMIDGKQLFCRGRPAVHCDPACYEATATRSAGPLDDEDVIWDE